MILPWNRPNTAAVTIIGIHFPCVWFQIELKNTPRNTASSQIAGAIPTTIIAIRTSLGSNDPTKIITFKQFKELYPYPTNNCKYRYKDCSFVKFIYDSKIAQEKADAKLYQQFAPRSYYVPNKTMMKVIANNLDGYKVNPIENYVTNSSSQYYANFEQVFAGPITYINQFIIASPKFSIICSFGPDKKPPNTSSLPSVVLTSTCSFSILFISDLHRTLCLISETTTSIPNM